MTEHDGPTDRPRRGAAADPDATAVPDALAATRAELAALRDPDVPPDLAARWAAALAAEARDHMSPRDGSVRPLNSHRSPRGERGRPVWRPLLAAAALAAVVGTGVGALVDAATPATVVTRVELVALGRETIGTMDVGGLADPARRAACLRAVAPDAVGETLLGGRRVVVDGRAGVLLVLATGARGGLRILTVDPACGPEGGSVIAQVVVGA